MFRVHFSEFTGGSDIWDLFETLTVGALVSPSRANLFIQFLHYKAEPRLDLPALTGEDVDKIVAFASKAGIRSSVFPITSSEYHRLYKLVYGIDYKPQREASDVLTKDDQDS